MADLFCDINVASFPEPPDDPEENEAPAPQGEVVEPQGPEFVWMPPYLLGNVAGRIADREFESGVVENERKIERFAEFTPTEIVLYFGQGFFELIQTCTNEIPDANITMKKLYCYHSDDSGEVGPSSALLLSTRDY